MNENDEKIAIDEISQSLGDRTDESGETAKHFIHTLFSAISRGLKKEDKVPIYKFGSFKKSWVDERSGIHPQTGEEITIPGHYRVFFTPSSNLAESVNWKYNFAESFDLPSQEEQVPIPKGESQNDAVQEKEEITMGQSSVQPVNQRETRALLGEKEERKRMKEERRRAFIAVLSAAVLVVCLLVLLLTLPANGRGGLEAAEQHTGEEAVEVVAREPEEIMPSDESETDEQSKEEKQKEQSKKPSENKPMEDIRPKEKDRELITAYTVEGGDTLVSITEEYWKDAHLWPDMYSNNDNVLKDPNLLFPGQKIEVLESLKTSVGLSFEAKEELLADYIMVYRLYRALGEQEESRNSGRGTTRFREARTVLYTATMYDPEILQTYKHRIADKDYRILTVYIEKNGPYTPAGP
jgi:nucleoid DNA-binding protein